MRSEYATRQHFRSNWTYTRSHCRQKQALLVHCRRLDLNQVDWEGCWEKIMFRGKYGGKAEQYSYWSKNMFTEFVQAACVLLSNEFCAISAWEGRQDGSSYIDQSRTILPARGSTETRSAASWIYVPPSISSQIVNKIIIETAYNSPFEISR